MELEDAAQYNAVRVKEREREREREREKLLELDMHCSAAGQPRLGVCVGLQL